LDRVFEIGRNFRNEGLSVRHNPEFTMLEVYQAGADYLTMADLVERIVTAAAASIGVSGIVPAADPERPPVDLTTPWRRASMVELVQEATGIDVSLDTPLAELRAMCAEHGATTEDYWGAGRLFAELYEATVEHQLWNPTIVTDFPVEVSPLARRRHDDPRFTERFEVVVRGQEIANAFTELNDPIDQRERFEAQAALKALGDAEAPPVDEEYLRALEYGLPPTGGLGVGIDRLVMLLTGVSAIREVLLFPTMRPRA
jgi:lysyl-tRNA synthetase class 2